MIFFLKNLPLIQTSSRKILSAAASDRLVSTFTQSKITRHKLTSVSPDAFIVCLAPRALTLIHLCNSSLVFFIHFRYTTIDPQHHFSLLFPKFVSAQAESRHHVPYLSHRLAQYPQPFLFRPPPTSSSSGAIPSPVSTIMTVQAPSLSNTQCSLTHSNGNKMADIIARQSWASFPYLRADVGGGGNIDPAASGPERKLRETTRELARKGEKRRENGNNAKTGALEAIDGVKVRSWSRD